MQALSSFRLRLPLFAALLLPFLQVAPSPAADPALVDIFYQEGQKAFLAGDYDTAELLLKQVLQINSRHLPTQTLLNRIAAHRKANPGHLLKKQLDPITLPKVEFEQADLNSCLDFLSAAAHRESGGKVKPNFILREEKLGERLVTLKLNQVPFNQALSYVADLAQIKVRYDQHAIVVVDLTDLR